MLAASGGRGRQSRSRAVQHRYIILCLRRARKQYVRRHVNSQRGGSAPFSVWFTAGKRDGKLRSLFFFVFPAFFASGFFFFYFYFYFSSIFFSVICSCRPPAVHGGECVRPIFVRFLISPLSRVFFIIFFFGIFYPPTHRHPRIVLVRKPSVANRVRRVRKSLRLVYTLIPCTESTKNRGTYLLFSGV